MLKKVLKMCTNFPLLSSNSDTMSLPEVDFIISLLSAKARRLTNDLMWRFVF
jgi:hypothetical protein